METTLGFYSAPNNYNFLLNIGKSLNKIRKIYFSRKNHYYTKFYLCEIDNIIFEKLALKKTINFNSKIIEKLFPDNETRENSL